MQIISALNLFFILKNAPKITRKLLFTTTLTDNSSWQQSFNKNFSWWWEYQSYDP